MKRAGIALMLLASACKSEPNQPSPPAPSQIPRPDPVAVSGPQPRAPVATPPAKPGAAPTLTFEQEISDEHAIGSFGSHVAFTSSRVAASGVVAERQSDGTWRALDARTIPSESHDGQLGFDGDELIVCQRWTRNKQQIGQLAIARLGENAPSVRFPGRTGDFTCDAMAVATNRIAVGAPGSRPSRTDGVVRIYERTPQDGWRLTLTLRAPKEVEQGDGFGGAVALDGNTLVVGAPTAASADKIWIYELEGTAEKRAARLVQHFAEHDSELLGGHLALDGDWLAAGGYHTVTLYQRRDGAWHEVRALKPPGEATFGSSVALRGDLLAVGDAGAGDAYVYWRAPSGQWTEIARYHHTESGVGDIGLGIAGDRIAIGAPWSWSTHDRHGSVRVYHVAR